MADQEKMIVSRVSDTDPANVVPGSVKTTAPCCGQEVWLSKASVKAQESHPIELVCIPCMGPDKIRQMMAEGNTGALPGAFDELTDWKGPLAAHELEMMGISEIDLGRKKPMKEKILNSSVVSWMRAFYRYTFKEQWIWAAYLGSLWIGVAYGVLAGGAAAIDSPLKAAGTAFGAVLIAAYPLYKIFFYRVELELRMVAHDDEAGDKMAIQLREKAKEVGLNVTHECKPDPIGGMQLPEPLAALFGQHEVPTMHPRHLVVEGFHWRIRKHAGLLQSHMASVSGVNAQVTAVTHLNEPFPGDGRED